MTTKTVIAPTIGQFVRPREGFAWRPACRVVELRADFSRPYLGNGFVAEYPNGERHLQWDGNSNYRFDAIVEENQP